MALTEITRIFEQRRAQIHKIFLEEPTKLTKKHQMYGAMKELDLFLEVLRHQEAPPKPKAKPKGFQRMKQALFNRLIKH